MSIYDMSVDVQLQLEAMQSADASGDLIAKARNIVESMDYVSEYLNGLADFGSRLSIADSPPIDAKATSAAIGAFRAGLSRYGAKALQQQPADKLVTVANEQRKRGANWAAARWKAFFSEYQSLLEEAQPGQLLRSSRHRLTAESRARSLAYLQRQDPVSDKLEITTLLCSGDNDAPWLEQLRKLGDELTRALQDVRNERAALTPDVQEALESAASVEGLSLADVTVSLLEKLRAAGVDEDLVVRRSE